MQRFSTRGGDGIEPVWGVIIVDRARAQVVLADDDLTSFVMEYAVDARAMAEAKRIAAVQNQTRAEIEEFLERI